MNSEKVKEIKESLQQEIHLTEYVDSAYSENVSLDLLKDVLTVINELENENAYQKEHIELWFRKNEEKKDRIVELETENALIKNSVAMRDYKTLEEMSNNKVKQFAERLKEELTPYSYVIVKVDGIYDKMDETLKGFQK